MNLCSSDRLVTVRRMDQDEFVLGLLPLNRDGEASSGKHAGKHSLCCKRYCSETANITTLSANAKHRNYSSYHADTSQRTVTNVNVHAKFCA